MTIRRMDVANPRMYICHDHDCHWHSYRDPNCGHTVCTVIPSEMAGKPIEAFDRLKDRTLLDGGKPVVFDGSAREIL